MRKLKGIVLILAFIFILWSFSTVVKANNIDYDQDSQQLIVNAINSQEEYQQICEMKNVKYITFYNIDFENTYDYTLLPKEIESLEFISCKISNFERIDEFVNLQKLIINDYNYSRRTNYKTRSARVRKNKSTFKIGRF